MSVTLRERRRRMLRDEILVAAQQLLGERGFAALAMDEVAQRVGVSKPTLYAHFPTREDLAAAMIGLLIDQLFATLTQQSRSESPLEQLALLLRSAIAFQVDIGAAAFQLWQPEVAELLRRHPASQQSLAAAQERVVALCRAAIEQGQVTVTDNPEHLARLFSALVCLPFAGGVPLADRSEAGQLADMAVRLLHTRLQSH
jgi:AcrR family transcriptional regulator